jgi:hypothetical protein
MDKALPNHLYLMKQVKSQSMLPSMVSTLYSSCLVTQTPKVQSKPSSNNEITMDIIALSTLQSPPNIMFCSLEEAENDAVNSEDGQDVSVADDDKSFRSSKGYDADSESRHSHRIPCNDVCQRTKRYFDDSQDAEVAPEVLLAGNTKRRRLRRHRGFAHNCSWIERIFSATPFAIPEDSDEFPAAYRSDRTSVCRSFPTCAWIQADGKVELTPRLRKDGMVLPTDLHHDGHSLPFASITNGVASDPKQLNLGVFTTLMNKLNVQTLDDEVMTLGLLTIVKDLLQDSYKTQAAYRTYSFNSHGCTESLIAVTEQR